MHVLRTAILEHTTADGVHHDWLIEDPTLPDPHAPDARLWTARVASPPAHWHRLGRLDLEVIAPHRRAYLAYQGSVSKNRGRVRRLTAGTCHATHWTRDRIILTIETQLVTGQWQLRRLGANRWQACASRLASLGNPDA